MGQEQSILEKSGYKLEAQMGRSIVATKDNEKFLIKKLEPCKDKKSLSKLISEVEILKETTHPHIASMQNSFKDENGEYLIVMDYCPGGTLAERINSQEHQRQYKALSWAIEICMALEFLHEKQLLHKDLTPKNIFFTEADTLCLGECVGKKASMGSDVINYLAPEVFTKRIYDAQSEIWSLGCILHEAYTHAPAFSAESRTQLIKKIIAGDCSSLPDHCSSEFCKLLEAMLNEDPSKRPTAAQILLQPISMKCLTRKCTMMTEHLQSQLKKLREVADSLERVHQRTTIGSLTGGVIGAAGGITSIVGLVLAPFTLGASLIVTGVGVGVGVAGGVAAGASNITKMVNETNDRKAIRSIIQDFDVKIKAVAWWLQVISNSLEKLKTCLDEESSSSHGMTGFATKLGRGLGGIAELCRLLRVVNIGKIAAQASRAVRVAETATGVLSALFLAADVFFIAMDAREIHRIRQRDTRSEIIKFVTSIREAADELQKILDEFKETTLSLPSGVDDRVLEKRHMK